MARCFTVTSREKKTYYMGFSRTPDKEGYLSSFIAIVPFDGEVELWGIDWEVRGDRQYPSETAIRELKRYYHEEFGREVDVFTYEGVKKF